MFRFAGPWPNLPLLSERCSVLGCVLIVSAYVAYLSACSCVGLRTLGACSCIGLPTLGACSCVGMHTRGAWSCVWVVTWGLWSYVGVVTWGVWSCVGVVTWGVWSYVLFIWGAWSYIGFLTWDACFDDSLQQGVMLGWCYCLQISIHAADKRIIGIQNNQNQTTWYFSVYFWFMTFHLLPIFA